MALFAISGVDMGHPGIGLRSAVGNGIQDSRSRTFLLPWGFSLSTESSRTGGSRVEGSFSELRYFQDSVPFPTEQAFMFPGPQNPRQD